MQFNKIINTRPMTMIAVFLLFSSFHSYAEESSTEAKFQIDIANEMQQLSWLSELAYRLSEYQKKLDSGEIQGINEIFCNTPLLTTNQLVAYLNKNHTNEKITADQAIETIFKELEKAYPCSE